MAILRQQAGMLTAAWNGMGDEVEGSVVQIPVSDAGSVMVAVAADPTPNLSIFFEGYDGTRWVWVNVWDTNTTSPSPITGLAISGAVTRIGNVPNFSQFRVRCYAFTAPASVILTADSDVISVPPMLGGTQGVSPKDITGSSSITSFFALSAASDNASMIGSASTKYLHAYCFHNSGATTAYVKLYNTATTPTSGSTPSWVVAVPAGQTKEANFGGGFGLRFASGLGIRVVGGAANADATAVAANQVTISIGYN